MIADSLVPTELGKPSAHALSPLRQLLGLRGTRNEVSDRFPLGTLRRLGKERFDCFLYCLLRCRSFDGFALRRGRARRRLVRPLAAAFRLAPIVATARARVPAPKPIPHQIHYALLDSVELRGIVIYAISAVEFLSPTLPSLQRRGTRPVRLL